jgi:hypothetical protein
MVSDKRSAPTDPLPCPVCGQMLVHVRMFNESFAGTGPDNPYTDWVCRNDECHGWLCEYEQEWHAYGTSCSVAMVRNIRDGTTYAEEDPNTHSL